MSDVERENAFVGSFEEIRRDNVAISGLCSLDAFRLPPVVDSVVQGYAGNTARREPTVRKSELSNPISDHFSLSKIILHEGAFANKMIFIPTKNAVLRVLIWVRARLLTPLGGGFESLL